jgi:hypothetical protein
MGLSLSLNLSEAKQETGNRKQETGNRKQGIGAGDRLQR